MFQPPSGARLSVPPQGGEDGAGTGAFCQAQDPPVALAFCQPYPTLSPPMEAGSIPCPAQEAVWAMSICYPDWRNVSFQNPGLGGTHKWAVGWKTGLSISLLGLWVMWAL